MLPRLLPLLIGVHFYKYILHVMFQNTTYFYNIYLSLFSKYAHPIFILKLYFYYLLFDIISPPTWYQNTAQCHDGNLQIFNLDFINQCIIYCKY